MLSWIPLFVPMVIVTGIIPIRFDGNEYVRIPAEFITADGLELIHGYIELQFGQQLHPLARIPLASHVRISRYTAISAPEIHETFEERSYEFLNRHSNLFLVSAHPDSEFARSNFVVFPTSLEDGIVELNPANPAQYALDNQLFFSTSSRHRHAWTVNDMVVRLTTGGVNDAAANPVESLTDFGICQIDGSKDLLTIPSRVMRELLDRLTSLGVSYTDRGVGGVFIENLTYEAHVLLPSIQFIMRSDTGLLVNLASVEPDEYLSDDWSHLKLRAWGPDSSDCSITILILKNLVVYFDSLNNKIGFGEPLIEL